MEKIKVKRSIRKTFILIFIVIIVLTQIAVGLGTTIVVGTVFTKDKKSSVDYLGQQISTDRKSVV